MSQPQSQFQFGALDRRAMEQERLERLAKRHHGDTDGDVVEIPPPKRQATASTSAAKGKQSKPTTSLPYPNGTVKRTWARGCARTGDDITIEEVFQKDQLELAVLSSFQWDEEWMLSKLDISKTKLLLLAFAKDEAQKTQMRGNVPANIKFCFPPMHGMGAMHSKLQLLKYPNRLRVVIPTGNLVPYDWGETGVMENMVFLIDLPRLENPATTPQSQTAFYTELVYFLQATGVGDKMAASLSNYDFSKTSDIAFVHTIPGSHTGKAAERTGYCGLGASVAALGLASSEPVEVDLLARCSDLHCSASLGAINHEFIEAIYNACRGRDGIEDFKDKSSGTRSKAAKKPDEAATKELQERFRIYFPTERTVAGSRGGRNAGGTICVQSKWWRSPTFPTELVRDVIARDRLLVHSKMIFVRRVGQGQTTQQRPGWAYVGSANLSESAWGRLSRDRSTKAIKMNCRNWECGVVLPVPESKAVDKARVSSDMAMFAGTVPVPMQVPGPAYASSDRPWFYMGA
ncbi:phospholipase D/nuclease [Trichoderma citrinoviride]|uniref:Phospholipase D/nuclease n=1 Tax=Trichoderma citrinoviride TaxID=58853 RepID=A0A2T4BB79_9HYPO|nr:phospholipase D/nuclease [Trichoderma citrinoviride]PTB66590.1 phospholipase D/nuclease [Trichoderma citrinoviride]